MSAVPDHVTATSLASVLLDSTDDTAEYAAIRLLADHGVWLARPSVRGCVTWEEADDEYPADAVIRWADVAALTKDTVGPATGSEVAVLGVALALAAGALNEAVIRCDHHNWALIVEAITTARGTE